MRKTRKQLRARHRKLLGKGLLSLREENEIQAIQQRFSKAKMTYEELYQWAVNYIAKRKAIANLAIAFLFGVVN